MISRNSTVVVIPLNFPSILLNSQLSYPADFGYNLFQTFFLVP